jgi:hypothetical protein
MNTNKNPTQLNSKIPNLKFIHKRLGRISPKSFEAKKLEIKSLKQKCSTHGCKERATGFYQMKSYCTICYEILVKKSRHERIYGGDN